MKRLALFMIVVATVVLLGAPRLTSAQEATPVANPMAPTAEECTVAPITADRLNVVFNNATPVAVADAPLVTTPAAEGSPAAIDSGFRMPEGTEADEATEAAVVAVVREYIACVNAGDTARVLALYSDNGLRLLLADLIANGITVDQVLGSFGTPQPLPADQLNILYGVDQVVVLADGRVAALAIGDNLAEPNPPGPALFYLVQTDGSWLVESFVDSETILAG